MIFSFYIEIIVTNGGVYVKFECLHVYP